MKNLVSFELSKVKKQKSLYICLAIMAALLFLSVFTMYVAADVLASGAPVEGKEEIPAMLLDYDMITSLLQAPSNANFTILIGIVIIIFVTSDFTQGTIKTVVARGSSRSKIYFAKLIVAGVMSVGAYLICLVLGLVFGIAFFGFEMPDTSRWLGVLAVQFVAALAIAAFSYLVAVTFRKTSTAILLIIFLPIGLSLVLGIIDIVADTTLSDYWISTVFENLSVATVSVKRIVVSLITSVCYLMAFVGMGYISTKKYDF